VNATAIVHLNAHTRYALNNSHLLFDYTVGSCLDARRDSSPLHSPSVQHKIGTGSVVRARLYGTHAQIRPSRHIRWLFHGMGTRASPRSRDSGRSRLWLFFVGTCAGERCGPRQVDSLPSWRAPRGGRPDSAGIGSLARAREKASRMLIFCGFREPAWA
jgi:hypothetical protein